MVVAPVDFRDEEYFEPKAILEKNGAVVITASTLPEAVSKEEKTIKTDVMLGEIIEAEYDGIVFVGGSGSSVYFSMEKAHKIARYYLEDGKLVSAICAAPTILANAGLLDGVKATSFLDEKRALEKGGAVFTNETVTVDGNIITANGPKAASAFGDALVAALS